MTTPTKELLRYRDAIQMLESAGLKEHMFPKLVDAGLIVPLYLPKGRRKRRGRAFYRTAQVAAVVQNLKQNPTP